VKKTILYFLVFDRAAHAAAKIVETAI